MNQKVYIDVFRKKWVLLAILLTLHMTQQALAEKESGTDGLLVGKIDYWFVGHLGQTDGDGRLLVWEATIEGGVTGKMKWWFTVPPTVEEVTLMTGRVSFYTARWEVWVDGKLLLAGESAGKTVFSDGADGIWDGHGRVTQTSESLENLSGRQIYETGPVILGSDPPKSFRGTGTFIIY